MPVPPLPKLRAELAAVSRRLHANGWIANHDGNVSVKLTGNRLLITPTAVSKADVDESKLIIVDYSGKVLEGRRKPFGELDLHLAIYKHRPEAEAVVHAHPPIATAFGVTGHELSPIPLPEMIVSIGDKIPTLPRAMPKDEEALKRLAAAAKLHDAMLLAGNGAISWGTSLEMALLRMELVEHLAKILLAAKALGPVAPLAPADIAKLLEARKKAGLGPRNP